MRAAMSLVICHLMIVFTLPRSFILYSFVNDFFIVLRVVIVFDAKRKSLTYTLTILVLSSDCRMKMLGSSLSYLKPMLLKKVMILWFQSFPDCLSSYRLLNSLYDSFSQICQSSCIPSNNCMNMKNLLLSKRLSRYAPTMST